MDDVSRGGRCTTSQCTESSAEFSMSRRLLGPVRDVRQPYCIMRCKPLFSCTIPAELRTCPCKLTLPEMLHAPAAISNRQYCRQRTVRWPHPVLVFQTDSEASRGGAHRARVCDLQRTVITIYRAGCIAVPRPPATTALARC